MSLLSAPRCPGMSGVDIFTSLTTRTQEKSDSQNICLCSVHIFKPPKNFPMSHEGGMSFTDPNAPIDRLITPFSATSSIIAVLMTSARVSRRCRWGLSCDQPGGVCMRLILSRLGGTKVRVTEPCEIAHFILRAWTFGFVKFVRSWSIQTPQLGN